MPDPFSYISRRFIAPLWAKKERSPYLHYLRGLEIAKRRDFEKVRREQWVRLEGLLEHAVRNTRYYKECFSMLGITPQEIRSWDDFRLLPFLTKEHIRANVDSMVAQNVPKDKLIPGKTSGSTGVSLHFYLDEASRQWKRAVTISYDRWTGWDIGQRVGAIWGNPEYKQNRRMYLRNLLLTRHTYLDTLKMDAPEMHRFYQKIRRRKPVILFGHAHSLYLFANFLEKNGLEGIRPKGIISTCMVLHDFERKKIESVFGCRVTNRYGCEEVSLIACECREGNMHLNCDSLYVEFIRDGKPVPPGEPGAVVVTDLTNYGMPFIRYKVGDVGIPSAKTSCPCGCTYPVMESLEGRVADYVVTPEKNYISGISLTENFAMKLPGIKQMQIVQEKLDLIRFRLVKGEAFDEKTVGDLLGLAGNRFGNAMKYEIEFVDSIQQESSGKYRFCISNIKNHFA